MATSTEGGNAITVTILKELLSDLKKDFKKDLDHTDRKINDMQSDMCKRTDMKQVEISLKSSVKGIRDEMSKVHWMSNI